jgi:hypothetical protein
MHLKTNLRIQLLFVEEDQIIIRCNLKIRYQINNQISSFSVELNPKNRKLFLIKLQAGYTHFIILEILFYTGSSYKYNKRRFTLYNRWTRAVFYQ